MNEYTPGSEPTPSVTKYAQESDLAAANMKLAKAERESEQHKDLLIELAHDVLELAETLDYEIGGAGQTLSRLANMGIIELPTKTVTLEGTLVRHFEYSIDVEVPVFDDIDAIDHDDYESEIADESANDVVFWEINPGSQYLNH
jgi:hypothetical protein